jgi:hypothetical protein
MAQVLQLQQNTTTTTLIFGGHHHRDVRRVSATSVDHLVMEVSFVIPRRCSKVMALNAPSSTVHLEMKIHQMTAEAQWN